MFSKNTFHNRIRKSDLQLEVYGNSAVGHKRITNEDAFLIADLGSSRKLLAVADAFCRRSGEDASHIAVSALRDLMLVPSDNNTGQRLRSAFKLIAHEIERHFRTIHHSEPVGTTLTAVYVEDDSAHVAHVGNSRAYLLRDGKVHRLTHDDTLSQNLIESGAEPGATSRKTLLQAVGVECELEPLIMEIELLLDDYLLLCSDGFSNMLYGPDIVKTIEENASLEVAVERLIEAADERDGDDNITVILARVCRGAVYWLKPLVYLQPMVPR